MRVGEGKIYLKHGATQVPLTSTQSVRRPPGARSRANSHGGGETRSNTTNRRCRVLLSVVGGGRRAQAVAFLLIGVDAEPALA